MPAARSGGTVSPSCPLASARARPDCTALRKYACASAAVAGYTGVSHSGSGAPAARTAGCSITGPASPLRNCPRTRSRAPTAICFISEG